MNDTHLQSSEFFSPERLLGSIVNARYQDLISLVRRKPYVDRSCAEDIVHEVVAYFLGDPGRIPASPVDLENALFKKCTFQAADAGRKCRRIQKWGGREAVPLDDAAVHRPAEKDWSFDKSLETTDETKKSSDNPNRGALVDPPPPAETEEVGRKHTINRLKRLCAMAPGFLKEKELAVFAVMVANIGEDLSQGQLYEEMSSGQRALFLAGGKTETAAIADVGRKSATMKTKVRNRFGSWIDFLEWGG